MGFQFHCSRPIDLTAADPKVNPSILQSRMAGEVFVFVTSLHLSLSVSVFPGLPSGTG